MTTVPPVAFPAIGVEAVEGLKAHPGAVLERLGRPGVTPASDPELLADLVRLGDRLHREVVSFRENFAFEFLDEHEWFLGDDLVAVPLGKQRVWVGDYFGQPNTCASCVALTLLPGTAPSIAFVAATRNDAQDERALAAGRAPDRWARGEILFTVDLAHPHDCHRGEEADDVVEVDGETYPVGDRWRMVACGADANPNWRYLVEAALCWYSGTAQLHTGARAATALITDIESLAARVELEQSPRELVAQYERYMRRFITERMEAAFGKGYFSEIPEKIRMRVSAKHAKHQSKPVMGPSEKIDFLDTRDIGRVILDDRLWTVAFAGTFGDQFNRTVLEGAFEEISDWRNEPYHGRDPDPWIARRLRDQIEFMLHLIGLSSV